MLSVRSLLILKKKLLLLKLLEVKRKRRKQYWVRKVYKDRLEKGELRMLVRDLRLHHNEYVFSCFRMSPSTFEELLSFFAPIIAKKYCIASSNSDRR